MRTRWIIPRAWSMVTALSTVTAKVNVSGVQAGVELVTAGFACFPTPTGIRFDHGPRAFSYRDATRDPAKWLEMADVVRRRHRCDDVNPALSPWASAEPLVVLDLDGPEAVHAFDLEHPMSASVLRIDTAGKGGGRHLYVVGAGAPRRGTHRWGGEIRSDTGHVMMPGSTIDGNRSHYQARGYYFASNKVEHILGGVGKVSDSTVTKSAIVVNTTLVDALSTFAPSPAAVAKFGEWIARIRRADVGTRHPTMTSAIGAAVAMAHLRILPLRWAVSQVVAAFAAVCPERDAEAEVAEVLSWTLGQEIGT